MSDAPGFEGWVGRKPLRKTMSAKSATAIDVAVGQRIRARRNELGISQTTLADVIGVTFQQVQKYEKGVNRVGASRLHEIAAALETTLTALLGESGTSAASLGDQLVATQWGARFAKAYLAIGDKDQRLALVMVAESMAARSEASFP